MSIKVKDIFSLDFLNGIIRSYSQVFFSNQLFFSLILILVSFFDLFAGACGLLAVIFTNVFAIAVGFNKQNVYQGLYGFNSVLVGLGIGIYFQPGFEVLIVLLLFSIFTLFVSVSCEGVIGKYALPFLSIPFLISLWILTLAIDDFTALGLSERGIYTLNDLYVIGGKSLIDTYEWWNNLPIPKPVRTYFISLGAILFQFNILSGIIISIGLLVYSRIAFSLSIIGFISAYFFYQLIGADISDVSYAYIGFNYILTSIAIGGYFLVPTKYTYFWTILLVPVVAILTISLSKVFAIFGLSIYSLPFNIVVLSFLYSLKLRVQKSENLTEVYIQQHSPEKNLYQHINTLARFGASHMNIAIKLPFWGEWTVSQAHEGDITHRDDYKHAWDFVVTENNLTYKNNGDALDDYYCYDKPVIAPAGGHVNEIVDGIEDNEIGNINLEQNWGNTIIIKHSDFLYSKLCHLKAGSFKVKVGDWVDAGTVLANCGSSGRSPEPHLHYQLQATPFIGSKTLDYVINHYIINNNGYSMLSNHRPDLNTKVSNITSNELLKKAIHFIPGKVFNLKVIENEISTELKWEVLVDISNNPYIRCHNTDSLAYFSNDGNIFYFKHFEGDKSSLLYYFYLALFKVQDGFYQDLSLTDEYPLHLTHNNYALIIQDLLAPFWLFTKSTYKLTYDYVDDDLSASQIKIKSACTNHLFGVQRTKCEFDIEFDENGLKSFNTFIKNRKIEATCV